MVIDIVQNNPFRVLGVYGNASARELTANQGKLARFAEVGRTASFPLDKAVEAPLARSAEDVAKASQSIQLPEDKIKYALFWFAKGTTDINLMACQHLEAGNREKAKELFGKQSSIASLINLSVLAACDGDCASAVHNMLQLLHNADYRNSLAKNLAGELFQKDEAWFCQLYMDVLMKELPSENWLKIFTENGGTEGDIAYLRQAKTGVPIKKIESEVAQAKSVDKKDADANLQAGRRLMKNTKPALKELKSLLPKTDVQYQMVVDKLATTILQCGINYYNNSTDDESPVQAIELQRYALEIAVGKMAVDRCRENVGILQKAVDAMPPAEVKKEAQAIKRIIEKIKQSFSGQQSLGKKLSPEESIGKVLQSLRESVQYVVSIKEKIGKSHTSYQRISTQLAEAALSISIVIVNQSLKKFENTASQLDRHSTMNYLATTLLSVQCELVKVVKDSWLIISFIGQLNLEQEYREQRYQRQRDSLSNLCKSLKIDTITNNEKVDMRTDSEVFSCCRTLQDYKAYRTRFSATGRHLKEAETQIALLEKQAQERKLAEEQLKKEVAKKLRSCYYIESIAELKKQYPNSGVALILIDDAAFKQCYSISDYKYYLDHFTKHKSEANRILEEKKSRRNKAIIWGLVVLFFLIVIIANNY